MRQYINVNDCKSGDIVAEDIFINIYSIPIIMKNSIINEYVKNKFKKHNIEFIHIIRTTNESEVDNKINKRPFPLQKSMIKIFE